MKLGLAFLAKEFIDLVVHVANLDLHSQHKQQEKHCNDQCESVHDKTSASKKDIPCQLRTIAAKGTCF
jgi:hypothetical protein